VQNNVQRLVGAPGILTLYLDGTNTKQIELRVTPLTDRDISEMDAWVRARVVSTAQASLSPSMSKEERQEVLTVAMQTAQAESMLSARGAEILGTIDGMARLMWQTIRKHHPEVTVEQLSSWMYNPINVDAATVLFRQLNQQWNKPKNNKGPTPRAGQKRRRK
jgi:hypothetical protein